MIRERVERPLLRLAARILERWTAFVDARLDGDAEPDAPVTTPTQPRMERAVEPSVEPSMEPPAEWLERATPTPPEHWLETVREHAPQLLEADSVSVIDWQAAELPQASVDVDTRPLPTAPRIGVASTSRLRRMRPLRLINPAVRAGTARDDAVRQRTQSVRQQPVALPERESLPAELDRPSFVRSEGDANPAPDVPLQERQKALGVSPPMRPVDFSHQPPAIRIAAARGLSSARPRVRVVQSVGMELNRPAWQERTVPTFDTPILRSVSSEGVPSVDSVYAPNQWPELLSDDLIEPNEEQRRELRRRERLDAEQRGSGIYSWNE